MTEKTKLTPERLRLVRDLRAMGLTQKQAAHAAGVSRSLVAKSEHLSRTDMRNPAVIAMMTRTRKRLVELVFDAASLWDRTAGAMPTDLPAYQLAAIERFATQVIAWAASARRLEVNDNNEDQPGRS